MTVRTWFRLLRAEAWEYGLDYGGLGVLIYFRNEAPESHFEPGPLRKPVRIFDLHDVQTLIEEGLRPPLDPDFVRYGFHKPSSRILN